MRDQLLDVLRDTLEEHRSSDSDTPVLKSMIEDEEIQRILRDLVEAEQSSEASPDRDALIRQLKERQQDILNDLEE